MLINFIYVLLTLGKVIAAIIIGYGIVAIYNIVTLHLAGYNDNDIYMLIKVFDMNKCIQAAYRVTKAIIKVFGRFIGKLIILAGTIIPIWVTIVLIII